MRYDRLSAPRLSRLSALPDSTALRSSGHGWPPKPGAFCQIVFLEIFVSSLRVRAPYLRDFQIMAHPHFWIKIKEKNHEILTK
jgi:hypothetical protein